MLVRGAVFAVVATLLFAWPVHDLSATQHSARWSQRLKSFFDVKGTDSLGLVKKLGVGAVLATLIGGSLLWGGHVLHEFVGNNNLEHSSSMLDTIIRFDDDIIGRTFHYTLNNRHYEDEVIEWNPPYTKMLVYSSYWNENILVPVENLLGKAIMWHEHQYAAITFIDPDQESYLLHGKVLRVFDNDYYYTLAKSQEDRNGVVTVLDEQRLVFVPKKLITTIDPLPLY